MTVIRKNVYELGGDWADPILWYARGVKAAKARALNDKTSWRFYGAIHGIQRTLWERAGYLSAGDTLPSQGDVNKYWRQCQHGTWYFLPWHRGYLIAFEAIIRDAIVKAGGPSTWTLPYWNYFKDNQSALPPAFASRDWPDGNGDNPLFVEQRYGPGGDGNVFVDLDEVDMNALIDPDFEGEGDGGSVGFGGIDTGFSHSGDTHGGIESQPHDLVHVLVGGRRSPSQPGLMSHPDLAGLDPIFWLHHGNIDRLWEVWRKNPPGAHKDPDKDKWKKGPSTRKFVMPMPDGQDFVYTPDQMSDLTRLGYTYDDLASPAAEQEGVALEAATRRTPMARTVELLGANTESIHLEGTEATTSVALDPAVKEKVTASRDQARLESVGGAAPKPADRVFLNLENVRGASDATAFRVYINLPAGADPAKYPEHLAGKIGLFGVSKATESEETPAGNGLTFVLDITRVIDALHLANNFDASKLEVKLVPVRAVEREDKISIGRIGIFRQGE